jgi:5-formaminoimidazole-4-carboxamide-1-(beta)-D-ribofuranosyl 5'-monophosphate synthetase
MGHTIATLGSHSALDVCEGAKVEGFKTLVVAECGREKTYLCYYKTRKRGNKEIGIVDEVLLLNRFKEITNNANIDFLKKRHAIFIPNRSFCVYVGYDEIEKNFPIPIFGNRFLLRAEERTAKNNQYELMKKAGINHPFSITSPEKIDRLVIVKVNEAKRRYERAFFLADSYETYKEKSEKLLRSGKISEADLKNAKIEEFIVGAPINFNFFYSPLHNELELLGIDMRRQTTLDGFLRMPADIQLEALKTREPTNIEIGHVACTVRESLLENVFSQAERLVETVAKEYPPGIIGPFALQGAIDERNEKEEFITFDISFRIPGSPGTRFTPYSSYLFRENISFGRRIAREIKEAEKKRLIEEITS